MSVRQWGWFAVVFAAGCEQEYNVQGTTDDAEDPVDLLPPVAIPSESGIAHRETALVLDGSESFDQDVEDAVLQYQWEIVTTPEGADAELVGADTVAPTFLADTLGVYEVSLTVTDQDGLVSENTALQSIEVTPWTELEVVLTWDADVDLDLHLIAPGGAYYGDNDCFFGNPEPDWGTDGDAGDDPMLNDDDDSSGGPEVIEMAAPLDGTYTVMVQYYNQRQEASPNVSPTLEIYAEGVLISEIEGPTLSGEGQVWFAGELDWNTATFAYSDDVTTHAALGGEDYNTEE